MTSKRSFWSLLISIILPLLLLVFPVHIGTAARRARTRPVDEVKQRPAVSYAKLPLSFEINQGQTDPRVKFLSRGSGYTLFLTGNEAVLSLQKATGVAPPFRAAGAGLKPGAATSGDKPTTDNGARTTNAVLRTRLVGANVKAAVTGAEELPGKSNYFIGNDPQKWRTNVPNYAKVRYQGVYPGVDLVYYGSRGGQLEYDFVVAPGADPSVVALEVGADGVRPAKGKRRSPLQIAANGDLVVKTEGGEVRFHKPIVYQTDLPSTASSAGSSLVTGHSSLVEGRYVLTASNQVHFALGPYDHTKPLVIDPALMYSTYLGGSVDDYGFGIAVDSSGNAYVTGYTASPDFPTAYPYQQSLGDGSTYNAFVAKLNAAGSALVYSTYLGGSGDDSGWGIAVDSSGNAYVTGTTGSTNFPIANALQGSNHGGSASFPYDAFVAKLNFNASSTPPLTLVYSTYLGGSGEDDGRGIAVDSSGNAYVTGYTYSTDFPTVNPFQAKNKAAAAGSFTVFVATLNSTGSALVYSTYLGGSSGEAGTGIAVDSSGNAYVTGYTGSTDFPTVNPLQAANHSGVSNGFVAKLNAGGSALVYFTYLGGSGQDSFTGIAVDSSGNAYVTGFGSSTNFPTANPLQATYGGGIYDALVAELNAAGSALVYSTYLGGSDYDEGNGIAVDSSGNAYVTGYTASTNFPTAYPLQATNEAAAATTGNYTAFVAKIPAFWVSLSQTSLTFGSQDVGSTTSSQTLTLTNTGTEPMSVNITTTPGFSETSTTCPSILEVGASCTITITSTPTDVGTEAGQLIISGAPGGPVVVPLTVQGILTPGNIATLAGGGLNSPTARSAYIPIPTGAAVDGLGNLYVVAWPLNQVLKVGTSGNLSVLAGTGAATYSGDGGPATSAGLYLSGIYVDIQAGVAVDAAGNVFIADVFNQRIRRVDAATGIITTVAGNGTAAYSGDGGLATSASLNYPTGAAVDGSGNLFIADGNNVIRRVNAATGTISTVAGVASCTTYGSGDGGPATSACLNNPIDVAVDGTGNIFIADTYDNVIRRVDASTGIITTVAGGGSPESGIGDGGPATSAGLIYPSALALDASANLFISDSVDNVIRRVDAKTGTITTVAGNSTQGFSGDGGSATSAALNLSAYFGYPAMPASLAVDAAGNLFIPDSVNNRIRRVDATTGVITTVAGGGSGGDGGPATSGILASPASLATDSSGNAFVGEGGNFRVRRVDGSTGIVTTVAGNGTSVPGFVGDGGPATSAGLATPIGLVVDSSGNLFISEEFIANRIRRVDADTGIITTVAGTGACGYNVDSGSATSVEICPRGLAVDAAGNLFIADRNNNRIRRVDATTGNMTTIAGSGPAGVNAGSFSGDGGPATSATLSNPFAVAFDSSGNLFINDSGNVRIRRVDHTSGIITTVAGNGTAGYSGDGGPATSASFLQPYEIVVDGPGNIFVADVFNNRIRRVDAQSGIITTVAGNATQGFAGDGGPATSASLNNPYGVALGSSGNLLIADSANNRIREVLLAPVVTLSTTSLSFIVQLVGTTSPAQTVTVTNSGGANLIISSIVANGDFAQTSTCPISPATLNPGSTCTISVTFTPTGVGTRTGTLTITDNASNSPQSVPLTGTGTNLIFPAASVSPTSLSFGNQLLGTPSAAQIVTLTSVGTTNLSYLGITITGTNASDFAETNNCPASMAPVAYCTINVQFTPSQIGTRTGTLNIADSASDSPQLVPLSGTGITSATYTYSPIAEPLIATGGTNPYQFTGEVSPFTPNAFNYKLTYPTLANPPTTSVNLVLQPFLILQADLDALVKGTGFEGAKIVPYDETGGFGVLFRATCQDSSGNPVTCPQTTGPYTHYTSWNTPSGAPPISTPAFLTAPAGTNAWQNDFTAFSQTRIDPTGAGHTCCGLSDFVFVDLGTSLGSPPTINITTPQNGAVFPLGAQEAASYSCTPTPPVVSCVGNVLNGSYIDTSSVGSKSFTVNAIVSSGPSANKTVTYTVTPGPVASVSSPSIYFGTVYLGTITTKNVTVTNQGDAPMTITDPLLSILSGGNSKEFIAVNLCPKSLAAGKSCTISVSFVAGPFYTAQTAILKVMDNAPGSPQKVALSATVINPHAQLSATSLSFGTQKVNTISTAKPVTLKNTGATALMNISIAIAGTDLHDFMQTNNCPGSLAANAFCTVNVTFKPTTQGLRSASVVITDNAQNSPQNISLSGTGK
jgi:sugar lactone lactonase YvrE